MTFVEQLVEFFGTAMPALAGGLLALATALVVFGLNQRATRRERLRARQDRAMEHVMDAFRHLQDSESVSENLKNDLSDSLLRFTWLLDGSDEIVTNWVNAKGAFTLQGLRERDGQQRTAWVGSQKNEVILTLRDWRLRPRRTKKQLTELMPALGEHLLGSG